MRDRGRGGDRGIRNARESRTDPGAELVIARGFVRRVRSTSGDTFTTIVPIGRLLVGARRQAADLAGGAPDTHAHTESGVGEGQGERGREPIESE